MPIGSANWVAEGMLGGLANVTDGDDITGVRFTILNQIFHGSHPLGWMSSFEVQIDGNPVPEKSVTFALRQQRFPITQLRDIDEVWWHPRETATIEIELPGGLEPGDHDVACDLQIPTVIFSPIIDRAGIYRTMPGRLEGTLKLQSEGTN